MKRIFTSIASVLTVGLLVVGNGCIVNEETDIVLTERFCFNYNEHQESATLTASVVCGFRDQILAYIEEENIDPEDIVAGGIVSGEYHVSRITKMPGPAHDWVISGNVTVKRQDDPGQPPTDGPVEFVKFTSQSLMDGRNGGPVLADLNSDGVALMDRALEALIIDGEDPRIVITVENSSVVPTPTPLDPMDFQWQACVRLQVVVRTSLSEASK